MYITIYLVVMYRIYAIIEQFHTVLRVQYEYFIHNYYFLEI